VEEIVRKAVREEIQRFFEELPIEAVEPEIEVEVVPIHQDEAPVAETAVEEPAVKKTRKKAEKAETAAPEAVVEEPVVRKTRKKVEKTEEAVPEKPVVKRTRKTAKDSE
jgi:hypothetical protein